MTGRGSRFAAFHVRDAVLPATVGGAILARFRATTGALPARGADVPTTGGGAFLPVDVAGVALPAIGDAATPAHAPDRGVAWPVRAAGLTDDANGRVPAPERRVFPAKSVRGFGDRNDRGCHVIRAGCDAELPGKLLPQCRRCRQIEAD